jgi:hypothetical protein
VAEDLGLNRRKLRFEDARATVLAAFAAAMLLMISANAFATVELRRGDLKSDGDFIEEEVARQNEAVRRENPKALSFRVEDVYVGRDGYEGRGDGYLFLTFYSEAHCRPICPSGIYRKVGNTRWLITADVSPIPWMLIGKQWKISGYSTWTERAHPTHLTFIGSHTMLRWQRIHQGQEPADGYFGYEVTCITRDCGERRGEAVHEAPHW